MTRTALITLLRILGPTANYDAHNAMDAAADMLEADAVAAQLALDALDHFDDVDKTETAIAALKKELKCPTKLKNKPRTLGN